MTAPGLTIEPNPWDGFDLSTSMTPSPFCLSPLFFAYLLSLPDPLFMKTLSDDFLSVLPPPRGLTLTIGDSIRPTPIFFVLLPPEPPNFPLSRKTASAISCEVSFVPVAAAISGRFRRCDRLSLCLFFVGVMILATAMTAVEPAMPAAVNHGYAENANDGNCPWACQLLFHVVREVRCGVPTHRRTLLGDTSPTDLSA